MITRNFLSSVKPLDKMLIKDKNISIKKDEKRKKKTEKEEDRQMVSEISNELLSNELPLISLEYINPLTNDENVDVTVLKARIKYVNHSSIKTINDQFPNNIFSFK